MNKYVLDASAVLALLNREPGHARVLEVLPESRISAVNACEVLGKLLDAGLPGAEARDIFAALGIETAAFTAETALAAALLRPTTKAFGLSLGDRSCLAEAALRRGSVVVTAERSWRRLKLPTQIEVIR